MEYYIKPDPQAQPETDFLKINSPEELKICDPACGSGHMLVYAFDLLYTIYEEEGYLPSEIPELILTKNLFGIEIDRRAGELAGFALTMKARAKDRHFFKKQAHPSICMLENVSFEEGELEAYIDAVGNDLFTSAQRDTLLQFTEADNFGSLIRPAAKDVSNLLHLLDSKNLSGNLSQFSTHQNVLKALKQADYLSPKYHVVIANPPYMGGKGMNNELKTFLQENYADVKSDLFSAFIERIMELTKKGGFIGMMTPFNWMFLSSFEKLRNKILTEYTLTNLVRPEFHAFFDSAYVTICGFTLFTRELDNFKGSFIDLQRFYGESLQPIKALEAIRNPNCGWFYRASAADFKKIPGSPIAYWVSERVLNSFDLPKIGEHFLVKSGLTSGDKTKYVRNWPECRYFDINFQAQNGLYNNLKWFPHNDGGPLRKWYGNRNSVINWESDGKEIRNLKNSTVRSSQHYFKPGVTWTDVSSSFFAARFLPSGSIFENTGSLIIVEGEEALKLLGFLSTEVAKQLMDLMDPTLHYGVGEVAKLPLCDLETIPRITDLVYTCISIAKSDWDSYETSWDFTTLPLLQPEYRHPTLAETYTKLRARWKEMTLEMQRLEEENNRIFIEAYGLQDEMTPDVPLSEITLTCNPYYRYGNKKQKKNWKLCY
jgi:type II restriction/modification system DNA methylase subunit YeeA